MGYMFFWCFMMQEYSQGKRMATEYFPQCDFQNPITSWQPYQQQQGISPSSSYATFTEIEHVDDLTQIGCISPFSTNMDYMEYGGNVGMLYDGYDTINPLSYQNPFWTKKKKNKKESLWYDVFCTANERFEVFAGTLTGLCGSRLWLLKQVYWNQFIFQCYIICKVIQDNVFLVCSWISY